MKLVDYRVEFERLAFVATGKPVHAWAAYGIARQAKSDVPEWVLQYLDKARRGLVFSVPDAVEAQGNKKNLGPVVARALGFVNDGAGTPFDYDARWWTYGRKVREFMKAGDKLKHARENAAEFYGVSESTIIRYAAIYDRACPEGDDHLVLDEDDLPEPDDKDRLPLVPMDDD